MTQAEIKRKRTESVLREVIPEALAVLNDVRINSLTVTDVVCSRGRDDAKVYLDKSFLTPQEQEEALAQLRKVEGYIRHHIRESQGWFKAPKLTFYFDEQFDKIERIEALFEQIARKRKGSDES